MDASHLNEKIYSEEGKFGEDYYQLFENRTRKIIELLGGFEGNFLDIGCGDGNMTLQIQNALKCNIEAIELIEENVKSAKGKGLSVQQVDLNKEKLPFEDNQFDGILAGEVIEHLIDSEGFLEEIKRVLKKDGVLILTFPNVAAWYNRFLVLFGYVPHWVESGTTKAYGSPFGKINGHVKAFTRKSGIEMLEDHGFKVEKVRGSGFNSAYESEIEKEHGKGLVTLGSKVFFSLENLFSKKSSLATNILVKAINKS